MQSLQGFHPNGLRQTSLRVVLGLLLACLFVGRSSPAAADFGVSLATIPESMRECVQQGLTLRIKFFARACKKRRYWFDSCGRTHKALSSIEFDPITGQYQVESDLYSDESAPLKRSIEDLEEALTFAQRSPDFSHVEVISPTTGDYLEIRALTYCLQDYNKTLDRLAQAITLGLVELKGSDSNWIRIDPSTVPDGTSISLAR